MSIPAAANAEPVHSRTQLIESVEQGNKPAADWRIGTEHEKFAFNWKDYRRLPYDGECGIRALLEGLQRFGWAPLREKDTLIGLKRGDASVSLEPGGQLELAGAPLENIHQTCDEVHTHLAEAEAVTKEMGAGLIGLGFDPKWQRADVPWMPKGRYRIMRDYMPKKGSLGLDMMLRTCTVQVNLDYASEADMVKKFRVGLALQPVATALFANSPFTEGKPNGFRSWRAQIWTDTDPDRTGMLPFAFEDGFGFERWVDYILDVPMYFVYRDGRYLDTSGQSFRNFMDGRLPALPGETPTPQRLGGPYDDGVPGSAGQDLPRDARRRWRAVEEPVRPAGLLGRVAVRSGLPWTPPGIWSGTGRPKNARPCELGVARDGFQAPFRGRQP